MCCTTQVVGDEQVGQPEARCRSCSRFTICAWTETSSAETGSSHDDQLGLDRQRAGDADALALAAGELVRIAPRMLGRRPDAVQQLGDPLAPRRPAAMPCSRSGSAIVSPTVMRGLSEA